MARSILINGQRVNIPGAYSTMDASALSRKNPAGRGIVAVLVELSQCWEPKTPHIFTSQGPMPRWMSKRDAVILGNLLFNPANDPDRIPNGASSAVIVPVNPATQASLTVNNGDGAAVTFDAALYGGYGNNIQVKQENGTTKGKKVTVLKDTLTEVADDIGDLDAFSLAYAEPGGGPGYIDFVKAAVDPNAVSPSPNVSVTFQFTVAGGTAAFNPSTWMAFDSALHMTFADQGGDKNIIITGVNKLTGATTTETITVHDDDVSADSTTIFSEVTSINVSAMAGDVVFSGSAFSLLSSAYGTILAVTDRINSKSARGFLATMLTGRSSLLITEMDTIALQNIDGVGGYTYTADLYDYLTKAPSYITYVTLSRATGSTGLPSNFVYTNLTGGATGTASNSDWQAAFDALKTVRVNSVVPMTSTEAVHSIGKAHCIYMVGAGRSERAMFAGTPNSISLTDLRSRLVNMNSPFVSLWAQTIDIYNESGVLETMDPMYQALQAASMDAGRSNLVSIVNAVPNVYGFADATDGTWDSEDDRSTLIDLGLSFYGKSAESGGYYVVIDNTTYTTDDNPIWSSITATGDAMLSTYNQRRAVEVAIGRKNFAGTKADVLAVWGVELDRQVREKEIRSYKPETMDLEDLGNGFNGDVELSVAEPLLFIHLTPHFVRDIPQG